MTESAPLIAALRSPACYTHPVKHIEVLETHISWVILTGEHAYKIKKPVNLGFLDFSTLEERRRCCVEELRLNRQFAPALYEAVVKITGSPDDPRIGGDGAAIEYAVKMREFPQSALASRLLTGGAITDAQIDALGLRIAEFHAGAGVSARGSPYGTPEAVINPVRENLIQLKRLLPETADQARLHELHIWIEREYDALRTKFTARQAEGRVRACHGDLHLGNIVMLDGQLTPFDCIEFNPALRWIDVMNETAFLVMDLTDRGRTDFAYRFLNAYLEATGDYAGLEILPFYLVYRAMVRAKVHGLRAMQDGVAAAERTRLLDVSRSYVELAQRCAYDMRGERPAFILMHGVSGSGKSAAARALAGRIGAIRLRSDIERKRLNGLAPLMPSGSKLASGIYTPDLTLATYGRLLDLARMAVKAGHAVIIDAAFLKRWQRDLFRRTAQASGIPFVIVNVTAPEPMLRARIAARAAAGGDPSEASQAVLTRQLARADVLTADELPGTLRIDTSHADAESSLPEAGEKLRMRLVAARPQAARAFALS